MGTGSPLRISPRLRRTGSYERRGKPNRVLDRTEQRRHLDELDQAAFGDNRSMNDQPDAARPSVVNAVTGQVSGFAVLAGTVNDGVHVHLPPRHAVEWPHRFGHVPPLAASFRHRAASSVVLTSDGPVSGGVLSGLGGVGKTQLAVDYAENAWAAGDLDLLMWITAASREAIVSGYAGLAAELTGMELDPENGARRLLAWLAATPKRWLVVLDDVKSPRDLRGLWPPPAGCGRVVVTTRRRDAALPHWRGRAGDPGSAVAALEELLADSVRVLGIHAVPPCLMVSRGRGREAALAGWPD